MSQRYLRMHLLEQHMYIIIQQLFECSLKTLRRSTRRGMTISAILSLLRAGSRNLTYRTSNSVISYITVTGILSLTNSTFNRNDITINTCHISEGSGQVEILSRACCFVSKQLGVLGQYFEVLQFWAVTSIELNFIFFVFEIIRSKFSNTSSKNRTQDILSTKQINNCLVFFLYAYINFIVD